VLLDLRMICLAKSNITQWFGYMREFKENCLSSTSWTIDIIKCSESLMEKNN